MLPTTFTVLNTANSGAGSLRQAIIDANDNPGLDMIAFDVGAGGVQTLMPTSPLPAVTDAAVIDGTTQPGFAGSPLIVVNGTGAGTSANGLVLSGQGATVRGLVVNGFKQAGIRLSSGKHQIYGNHIGVDAAGNAKVPNKYGIYAATAADLNWIGGESAGTGNLVSGNTDYGVYLASNSNRVYGNRIGTNSVGTAPLGNTLAGIFVYQSRNNVLGGASPGMSNLISGTEIGPGILIWGGYDGSGPNAIGNVIKGNRIGTDSTGLVKISNHTGIYIDSNAPSNVVGGSEPGAGNVVSGSTYSGIKIHSKNCIVQGNRVGTDVTGTAAIGNGEHGLTIEAEHTLVGGHEPAAGNVISANGFAGLNIYNAQNVVLNNLIGTDVAGSNALPNEYGMTVGAWDSVIGLPGAGNVISGNKQDGIFVSYPEARNNSFNANRIGTDVTGTYALPNGKTGIMIYFSPDNKIGGSTPGAGNLISGNGSTGINIGGQTADRNLVAGNFIGTDVTGKNPIPNKGDGISITGSAGDNMIGGLTPSARNVISGNALAGIALSSSASSSVIQGNYIGTTVTGTAALANQTGIAIRADVENTLIGGPTEAARNVISGNTRHGILFTSQTSYYYPNFVQGNFIGTDRTGLVAVGNGVGVQFENGAVKIVVGGTSSLMRNIISGNSKAGVFFGSGANTNSVLGNYIGADVTGLTALGNGKGVIVSNAHTNTIGGTIAGTGNLISGNVGVGLDIEGASSNTVQGNWIGLDFSGSKALPNGSGVRFHGGESMTIGGTPTGAGNVISGNAGPGITISKGPSGLLTIAGNLIGTDASGLAGVPNLEEGIYVTGSSNTTIGGATAAARNIISGNSKAGIRVASGALAVQGNYIGTDITGTVALGNRNGVVIEGAAFTLGGTSANVRNIISGNVENGVVLSGVANSIQGNYIGTDPGGTKALPNAVGVLVSRGAYNRVGGLLAGAGNLISGNAGAGIAIQADAGPNLRIEGNWIGTDATGTAALGNQIGISVAGQGHLVGGMLAGRET